MIAQCSSAGGFSASRTTPVFHHHPCPIWPCLCPNCGQRWGGLLAYRVSSKPSWCMCGYQL